MRNRYLFFSFLISFALIVVGCSGLLKNETMNETPPVEEVTEKEDVPEEKVFDKARTLTAYFYEVDTDLADGTSYESKVWVSDNKTKIESYYPEDDEKISMIIDGEDDAVYYYKHAKDLAMKVKNKESDFLKEAEKTCLHDTIQLLKELADDDSLIFEDSTLKDKKVQVVTGKINDYINKVWISKQTGLPLKLELYTNDVKTEQISSATFKNFKETFISSLIFQLPEDITIQDMTKF